MLTLFLLFVGTVFGKPTKEVPELTAPEVRVSIAPSSMDEYQLLKRKGPDTFTCDASVAQAGTNRVYLRKVLVVTPGHAAQASEQQGQYSLDFSVSLRNQRAESVVTVKRGEAILTRQRSTTYLKTDEGAVPLR